MNEVICTFVKRVRGEKERREVWRKEESSEIIKLLLISLVLHIYLFLCIDYEYIVYIYGSIIIIKHYTIEDYYYFVLYKYIYNII